MSGFEKKVSLTGDRGFESISLHRRVTCEPGFLGEERLPLSADWRNDQRMVDQAEQVSTIGLVDTKQQPGATKRRQYSEALKRRMVAETLAPGASVSIG